MVFLSGFIDIILHIDKYLSQIIADYGFWTYLILFIIIFLETGLVATPFLPGDSLLFAAGAFAASGSLDVKLLILVITSAAILGDTMNYWIGHHTGARIYRMGNVRFVNKEHLERAHQFYEKHGGKTIAIARFLPVIRTFAPFVAGIGRMDYLRFLGYNVAGGALWVLLFVSGGYYFGNLPLVKENFSLVIFAIIIISLLPVFRELVRHYLKI